MELCTGCNRYALTVDVAPDGTRQCAECREMFCPICQTRKSVNAGATCGDSYCSEASYHLCMAKGARKGSKRKREHLEAAERARTLAVRWC